MTISGKILREKSAVAGSARIPRLTQMRVMSAVFLLAALLMPCAGCARHLSGKYTDDNGGLTMEFKDGKVYQTVMFSTVANDYTINGKELVIGDGKGNGIAFTIQDDGTITGMAGGEKLHPVK